MPIKQISPPATKRKEYKDFKGVDFSTDPLLVNDNRSPYAVNLISDKGGQPEKRSGWRVLKMFTGAIHTISQGFITSNVILVHAGTKLYNYNNGEPDVLCENLPNEKSLIFFALHENQTKAFILVNNTFVVYDGTSVVPITDIATIPVILIAKSPTGGGTKLQDINLIQPKRTEKFIGDGTSKVYQLSAKDLDVTELKIVTVANDGAETVLSENTDFTVNRTTGSVTFTTAPAKPEPTRDNVYITYAKTVEGYFDRISQCKTMGFYGIGGNNRVFLTRNSNYKAYDWWSELNNATYYPDLNYAIIGNSNTAVMGYAKLGENMLIIKEDNQQDTTIFSRTSQLLNDIATFPIKQGVTGVGAIAPESFVQLIDEPLFLSRTGIYAVTSNVITAERSLQNRSFYVDPKLTAETDIQNAIATEWNGYYLLAINNNVYLLDSRQKSYSRENPNSFVYECFYWENVPVNCFMIYNGDLYFGTKQGQFCRFNNDIKTMDKYSDNGEAITAIWSTKLDNDGLPEMLKTMQKKGCTITLKPFTRSSVKFSYVTDGFLQEKILKQTSLSIFNWGDIDFEDFSFISNNHARTIVSRKKIKKYGALQFIATNDIINQGFGIFSITKYYHVINFRKK